MTIWIDVVFFGPFYFLAVYAFVRGRKLDQSASPGVVRHHAGERAHHPDGRCGTA